jgi:uncharacterized membrane protein
MEASQIFIWWLTFFIIGVTNLPLTVIIFKKSFDVGYGFTKLLGLFFISYFLLLGGLGHLLPFTISASYLTLGLLMVVNFIVFVKNKKRLTSLFRKNFKRIILQESIFTFCLIGWSLIRSYHPEIRGLEKFMDLGFINSILRSRFLPAPDMWFAGKSLNYYWFGHFFTAVATRLSTLPSSITYNLMIATILGFSANGIFSIVASLVHSLPKKFAVKAISAGLISAILVCFAGNLHTPIYVYKNGVDRYWYPDATRFIGYNPETNDKTIHEFPIYSFVVSDLHAHLLGLPLVILFLGLLWNVAGAKEEKSFVRKLKKLLLPGLVLGGMFMTNTWDFASYLIAAAVALFFVKLLPKKFSWGRLLHTFLETLISVSALLILGIAFALPFILNFSSMTEGVKFVHSHSPLWQLAVLWGFPAVLTVIFLCLVVFGLKKKIKKADIFILSLLAASWILIVIPEIIYFKDIYIASHYRANTMFKITYQAYVMFYLTGGFIAVRTISKVKNVFLKILSSTFFTLLFTSVLMYPILSVQSYYGRLQEPIGLNGEVWLKETYPGTYNTVVWLRNNVLGQPVILEAPGSSYTDYNIISSYTGLPTPLGWFVHEWLWHGGSEAPTERTRDIDTIYETPDALVAQKLLEKYGVKYVVVGRFEKEKYPEINEQKFSKLGSQVFSSEESTIYLLSNQSPTDN